MNPGDFLVIRPGGTVWTVNSRGEFIRNYVLAEKLQFTSAASARTYAEELSYAIAHADEVQYTPGQVDQARMELRLVRQIIAAFDE